MMYLNLNPLSRLVKPALSIMLTLVFIWSDLAISSDDLYLKQLEAEVSSHVENATTTAIPDKVLPKPEQATKRKKFEELLQNEKPSTFRTYELLKEEAKIKVIDAYFNNNTDLENTSRLVFELYYK